MGYGRAKILRLKAVGCHFIAITQRGREVLGSMWVDGGVCEAEVTLCLSYHSSGHYENRKSGGGGSVATPSLTTPDTPAHSTPRLTTA
jgi:hypothetical protein